MNRSRILTEPRKPQPYCAYCTIEHVDPGPDLYRHGHYLWWVTCATSVYLVWAPTKADVEPVLRRHRYGQGALTYRARKATKADLATLAEAGSALPVVP